MSAISVRPTTVWLSVMFTHGSAALGDITCDCRRTNVQQLPVI